MSCFINFETSENTHGSTNSFVKNSQHQLLRFRNFVCTCSWNAPGMFAETWAGVSQFLIDFCSKQIVACSVSKKSYFKLAAVSVFDEEA